MTDLIAELKALKEKATLGALAGDGALLLHGHRAALARKLCNHLPTILAKLEEGERMREALAFYAAPESYQRDIDPDSGCLESQPVIADDGDIARRALTPTQESETP